jgi:TatD DNase family protein
MAAASRHVRVALGLHPQLVSERESEVPLFEHYLSETRYVGEIGLDAGPRFYKSFDAQERVFARILRACAEHGDKILTIHSVRAVSKVLGHLEHNLASGQGRIVLHWFTGTSSEARRAIEMGCYFSINAEMLKSTKHRALIASLPADRLLTETDGPFVEVNGQALRPRDVANTVKELATIRNLSAEALAKQIISNLGTLVRD